MSGSVRRKSCSASGASAAVSASAGLTSGATGSSAWMTGAASPAAACAVRSVVRACARKGGSARSVAESAWLRRAVAASSRLPAVMSPCTSPAREPIAEKTWPLSETRRRTAACCESRIASRSTPCEAVGPRLPSTSERSPARPCSAAAIPVIHWCSARRVGRSNARSTSSSSICACTLRAGSTPPSGSFAALGEPGDSATYVSPSRVLDRRIACESAGSGAYWDLIWIVARVRPIWRVSLTTLPTSTPEMRTSACSDSVTACGKSASKR